MIEIDGSLASGSGTVLRDAVSYSILKRQPLVVTNIRAKREKPGLRPQHLKAVEAAAEISNGRLGGASIGSSRIEFEPGGVIRGGDFSWDIGTAGSITMLGLCLLPLGLFADGPSRYRISGGMFQDFAPSAFHLQHVLIPLLKKMGAEVAFRILRPGYVPRGQGMAEMRITPAGKALSPIGLTPQGNISVVQGCSLSSHLKERRVSERMVSECRRVLEPAGLRLHSETLYDEAKAPAFEQAAAQPGAALAVWAETDTGRRIGSDMAGARGRSAETIGKTVARRLLEDLASGAGVDRHLADQLIPFAALAGGKSEYLIPRMTEHVEARLWLAQEILGAGAKVTRRRIGITGIAYTS